MLPQKFLRPNSFFFICTSIAIGFSVGTLANQSSAMDEIDIERSGVSTKLTGEILLEAQDGGLMVRTTDGNIWMLQPDEVKAKKSIARPFKGMKPDTAAKQIISQLPKSTTPYRFMKAKNYAVVYNTTPAFANWVKSLYLRLNVGFKGYWKNQGVELKESDVPLCVIIFKSKKEFDDYSIATLGSVQGSALAYYNMKSNQVVMYDLTGTAQFSGRRVTSSQQINAIFQRPEAEPMIATIIHEAVHQIAFNSGLQKRFAPCPFWLNEGLAMYFEVPDLKSKRGWNAIGQVNNMRLRQLRKMLSGDQSNFFDAIIQGDQKFREPEQILNSYAEAWAMTYFLMKRKPKELGAYLKQLNASQLLSEPDEEQRVALFEKHFGKVADVKAECFRFILK